MKKLFRRFKIRLSGKTTLSQWTWLFIAGLSCLFFLLIYQQSNHGLKERELKILAISDIHLNLIQPSKMQILPKHSDPKNDLDPVTLYTLLTHLKASLPQQPDVILLLGDHMGHHRQSKVQINETLKHVFKLINKTFSGKPIINIFGNNDSYVVNYGPYRKVMSPSEAALMVGYQNGFLSTGVICKKNKHQYPCIDDQSDDLGFASIYLKPQLKLIALNSVMYSPRRREISQSMIQQSFEWLGKTLAHHPQDQNLIAMHIPVGNSLYHGKPYWTEPEENTFINLVEQYHNHLMGIIVGHSHMEEIKLIKNHHGHNVSAEYFVPALSTSHGNAPGFKLFTLTNQLGRWQLTNYQTYFFDDRKESLQVKQLYDFKKAYCQSRYHLPINDCLDNVTLSKMKPFYQVGNPNATPLIKEGQFMRFYQEHKIS
jgi:sphingomyelin phosphodiesterase acid-like 3